MRDMRVGLRTPQPSGRRAPRDRGDGTCWPSERGLLPGYKSRAVSRASSGRAFVACQRALSFCPAKRVRRPAASVHTTDGDAEQVRFSVDLLREVEAVFVSGSLIIIRTNRALGYNSAIDKAGRLGHMVQWTGSDRASAEKIAVLPTVRIIAAYL